MLKLISDDKTYSLLNKDPTTGFEKANNRIIKRLADLNLIDKVMKHRLTANNSICPRIYGLPKAHKPELPLRPVVPNITAPSYNLSKFIGKIIQNSIKSSYNIMNSFEFCDFIGTMTLPEDYILISLDVVSLFTCIPKDLVLHDIIYNWDDIRDNANNINLDLFLEIVEFCFDCSFFRFDNKFYKQIFGTAMGNPLSPILADLVMEGLLKNVVPSLDFTLPFINKYVDDLITAIPPSKLDYVVEKFNSYNQHIQFTCEKEMNRKIPFLDMLLTRQEDQTIITSWYQKPIASGRFLDYLSIHPLHQKINVAKNFISRVDRLSPKVDEKTKIELMDSHLKLNNYPVSLRHRLINSRKCKKTVDLIETEQCKYKSISYIPGLTDKIGKFLKTDYSSIKLATKTISKIKQIFTKVKDPVHQDDFSNVVYSIPCNDCDSQYIGMTTNTLKERIGGHKSNKKALDKLRSEGVDKEDPRMANLNGQTALLHHSIKHDHSFDLNGTRIIDRHNFTSGLQTLEMCHIARNGNTVNKKTDTEGLSVIYAGIFNSIKNKPKHTNTHNNTPNIQNTTNTQNTTNISSG
ncbi:uncharacterized protein LOC129741318 [Uranotaenia lowii]|uniref:uncharacterized protein LOC129741318 n=1 Tax=Uranotaenia lowii TaxID=190385 RepID=UPI002479E5C8|nr:uncharacterized protein LOC129741318 [Uranotaenia lowii]